MIDGSDRGELLPLAEAPFRLGWEAQELWGEPSAPQASSVSRAEAFFRAAARAVTHLGGDGAVAERSTRSLILLQAGTRQGAPVLPEPFEQACAAFGL